MKFCGILLAVTISGLISLGDCNQQWPLLNDLVEQESEFAISLIEGCYSAVSRTRSLALYIFTLARTASKEAFN